MELCYRSQRRICAKKGKDVFFVKNRKRGSSGVSEELVKKGIYLTIKFTINVTGILCVKEGLISDLIDNIGKKKVFTKMDLR